jgi:hypothetical protein
MPFAVSVDHGTPGLWISLRARASELRLVYHHPMEILKPSRRLHHFWGDVGIKAYTVTVRRRWRGRWERPPAG